ncbi:MAG TPA: class I SAM-dependent methyltransferase [Candidatus Wallbacteria bacterium]|mgnify:CR=1 FL=1|nr:class I SAM-dependent methyltransferase [Candidatus Wallbacteria bacterium]
MKNKINIWDEKSKSFPVYDRSDVKDIALLKKITDTAISRGVVLSGKNIIDIGCGTGRHTLNLANVAKHVHGSDVSEMMVEKLVEAVKKYEIGNVTVSIDDWDEIDIDASGWRKKFDVAWAAMTGAVYSPETLTKMMDCANEHCVCIAWGKKRINHVLERIYKEHGKVLELPPGSSFVTSELAKKGFPYTIDYIENSWTFDGTKDEVVNDLLWHLKKNKIKADVSKVEKIVEEEAVSGKYRHCTKMEMGIIVWKPQK